MIVHFPLFSTARMFENFVDSIEWYVRAKTIGISQLMTIVQGLAMTSSCLARKTLSSLGNGSVSAVSSGWVNMAPYVTSRSEPTLTILVSQAALSSFTLYAHP